MSAPVTHFLPLTLIQRERVLPQPGKVFVRAGQSVGPMDVIAETSLNPEYQLLNIARILNLPVSRIDRYLQCQAGDQLAHGDVIAGPVGISNRLVRARKDSKVILAGDGQVLLEVFGKPFQLKAGLPGNVIDLIPDRGAVIETTGALIQAVWGNGLLDSGPLEVVGKKPDHSLSVQDLDISLRGTIVLAGLCQDVEALKMAVELPLRGLILGSLDVDLLPAASKLSFPVVLIEGFGERPMNPIVYKLLSTNNRRDVALNAEAWDRYTGKRPEIILPLPAPGNTSAPRETGEFSSETMVRILKAPYAGRIGIIQSLKGTIPFPGGLRSPSAEIRFEDGDRVVLPLANLEMIA